MYGTDRIAERRMRGFTLVELLVVISIIALLLSILMPSLQKAREQAKSVICRSNEKQQSLAMGMYVLDNNGYLAPSVVAAGFSTYVGSDISVYERLEAYGPKQTSQDVTNPKGIWICPSDKPANGYPKTYPPNAYGFTYFSYKYNKHVYVSYAINLANHEQVTFEKFPYGLYSWSGKGSRKIDQIRRSSTCMMFTDSSQTRTINFWQPARAARGGFPLSPFHDNGKAVNYVAVDGHVEAFRDFAEPQGYYRSYGDKTFPENLYRICK